MKYRDHDESVAAGHAELALVLQPYLSYLHPLRTNLLISQPDERSRSQGPRLTLGLKKTKKPRTSTVRTGEVGQRRQIFLLIFSSQLFGSTLII